MDAKAAAHDAAVQMIGTSIVRVRQHAACIACNKGQSMAGREEVSPARYMRWSMAAACRSGSHSQRAKRTTAGLPQSSCPALSRDQCCWLTETMMPTAPPVPAGWNSWTLRSPHQTQELPGLAPGCSESYKTSQSGGRSRELFRERPTLQRIKTSSGAGLINTAPNSTPGLTEITTIHSTVYSPRMSVGDGLRSIDINCNTA